MSAKGRSIETRVGDALEACARALASLAQTNAQHFELARSATAKSMDAYAETRALQEAAIRRSIEAHQALMERHQQVSEWHELTMAAAGARAPDFVPDASAPGKERL